MIARDSDGVLARVRFNRGNHFEVHLLPFEAQLAPAFGICVADFDGDGHEDIFLAQNFFACQPETPRYDAGRGLWLRGNGHGEFTPVVGQESGIKIYGEQRGCAVADFDGDGRVDLAVAQNGAEMKLYRNTEAKPGLRIRVQGPAENPHTIGACVRLGNEGHFGPMRELHSGSGYWSEDSAVSVMNGAPQSNQLWIRCPGGKTATVPLPANAREITVNSSGQLATKQR